MPAKASKCVCPSRFATRRTIFDELAGLVANHGSCTSICLPSGGLHQSGEDHYQGLARTHRLLDGSVYFFLAHSEVSVLGIPTYGRIVQYRFDGPTRQDHVLDASSSSAALEEQLLVDSELHEQHPSDITFLPDVNGLDAGYLFVTEEYDDRAGAGSG